MTKSKIRNANNNSGTVKTAPVSDQKLKKIYNSVISNIDIEKTIASMRKANEGLAPDSIHFEIEFTHVGGLRLILGSVFLVNDSLLSVCYSDQRITKRDDPRLTLLTALLLVEKNPDIPSLMLVLNHMGIFSNVKEHKAKAQVAA